MPNLPQTLPPNLKPPRSLPKMHPKKTRRNPQNNRQNSQTNPRKIRPPTKTTTRTQRNPMRHVLQQLQNPSQRQRLLRPSLQHKQPTSPNGRNPRKRNPPMVLRPAAHQLRRLVVLPRMHQRRLPKILPQARRRNRLRQPRRFLRKLQPRLPFLSELALPKPSSQPSTSDECGEPGSQG